MFGIIVYLYFLFVGFVYSNHLFKEKDFLFNIWMGCIFGNAIFMVGTCAFAMIFGFNIMVHILLIAIVGIIALFLISKDKEKDLKKRFGLLNNGEMGVKVFAFLVLPFTILIALLMENHILAKNEVGAYSSGQSTYGDLNFHTAIITSIEQHESFPPEFPILVGHKLNYPFLVDMMSSSLMVFGTSLRTSIMVPSIVLSMLLIMGVYYLAFKITNNKSASILSVVFIMLCGGFGFAYFLEGAKADISKFTEIFTAFYHTPTNFNENNIRWSNTICDMIIPQRTSMAGWAMIMPCLWLLIDAVKDNKRKSFIILGFLASFLPMIHTHSFLALGVISAGMFFAFLIRKETTPERKNYIINWIIYGVIVLLIAFPQLILWTFSQASRESFMKFHFNWVNVNDPYIWFYLKNWGIFTIFLIPAFMNANKDKKRILLSTLPLFVLAELILFQPLEYDNNKLFYIVFFIIVIIESDYFVQLWDKLKNSHGTKVFYAILIIFLGTFSGVLTIAREWVSGREYQTYNLDMIELADFVKNNTPKDAVFLTGEEHINPISGLSGRYIYLGSGSFICTHGYTDEYWERMADLKNVYENVAFDITDFCREKNISYILISDSERYDFNVNMEKFSKYEKVFQNNSCELYKIDI